MCEIAFKYYSKDEERTVAKIDVSKMSLGTRSAAHTHAAPTRIICIRILTMLSYSAQNCLLESTFILTLSL